MHIEINSEKANNASMRLLDLSRTVRRSRECVEDARRQLRQLSDLDECRSALQRQEEDLALLTARIVNLSNALREIAEVYRLTEERSAEDLEDVRRPRQDVGEMVIYWVSDDVHRRIQKILYK